MKGKKTSRKRKRRKKRRAKERNRRKRALRQVARARSAATARLRLARTRRLLGISSREISFRTEFDYDNPVPLSSTDPAELLAEVERHHEALQGWTKSGYPARGEA